MGDYYLSAGYWNGQNYMALLFVEFKVLASLQIIIYGDWNKQSRDPWQSYLANDFLLILCLFYSKNF